MLAVNAWTVFLAALVTAVATGLGALPFLFVRRMSRRWLGIANAIAAGLMLAASFGLMAEGSVYSPGRTIFGILAGAAFIALSHGLVAGRRDLHIGALRGADALKALMIVGIMTVHSAAEGIGVGVAYGGGEQLGVFITAAIAVHNIPEGLAISLVLVPRGAGVWQAAGWSVFSSLPQPLLAVPAFLFVTVFQPFLPVGLGLAAGAMIWMALAELIPDALEDLGGPTVASTVTASLGAMLAFQELLKG
ncbi:MAG TPA: ZIP family metal transporter [Geminicoccaceae bacterium]|nr:ZIP family metal transporter [Geminicoccaceae bacterium]